MAYRSTGRVDYSAYAELGRIVFIVFAKLYFAGEPLRWNYLVGMALIFAAVFVVFYDWQKV